MKIIRTSEDALNAKKARQLANVGCDKCPCCGESYNDLYYIKQGISNRGIVRGGIITHIRFGVTYSDSYSCLTCGAQWESDEYKGQ